MTPGSRWRFAMAFKKLDRATIPGDKTRTQGQIDAANREIHKLVFEWRRATCVTGVPGRESCSRPSHASAA